MSETRCFEKVTGRVVQTWQISREGIRCHMGWGRVGGRQRGQTMTLSNEAHAERHFEKKISEKKRQGYVEVDVDPVLKPVKASAEAMADASLFDVMLEEKKHLYSRDYAGVPVEGRERVFVTFLNNLNMPEESLHEYLVLSADERRGVEFIVKNRGHDPAHVSAFLDFVCPRVDLAFDGRSHHKIALPSAVGQFGHVLFCAPSLCHIAYMGRLGMVFPIFDCEIGDEDSESFVDVRINSRDSIPFTTWDRVPFPVIDMKFDLHSENGFKELGGRTPFREKRFKVYPRENLEQTLRMLSVATAGSRLEIRNYRCDVLTITAANLTRRTPAAVDRFLLEGVRPA
jgi:predicted DNA-binding WGR domain protein